MRGLLNDLLISEVATVAGTSRDAISNWLRFGQLTRPRLRGKHRQFTAQNTVEVVLMTALTKHGLKPSVAGPMAVRAAPHVLAHYTDDWAEQRGDEIVMTVSWSLMIDLRSGASTVGQSDSFGPAFGDWLRVDLKPVMGNALTRAVEVKKARV